MKNPTTFIAKDGVSDADLMRAARDMYEALEEIRDLAKLAGNHLIAMTAEDVIYKARGEDAQ